MPMNRYSSLPIRSSGARAEHTAAQKRAEEAKMLVLQRNERGRHDFRHIGAQTVVPRLAAPEYVERTRCRPAAVRPRHWRMDWLN